jgi:phage tail sheath protein FI
MAEILISPGVLAREIDRSQVAQQPVQVGAAIIGPTVKGPVELPTVVTSYSDYVNKFGDVLTSGSDVYSYFTSISAYNYFNNGGTTLLVARVVTGSYTSATSTPISASVGAGSQPAFTLTTISKGVVMNNSGSLDAAGALISGSADNIRWEIVGPNTSSGTFSLLIRQGNDVTNSKTVLETYTNLSLDPKSPNYISKVIGDYVYNYNSSTNQIELTGSYVNNSAFVYVSSVNLTTPDYLDNNGVAKNQYTASIPLAASGAFAGATGAIKGAAQFYNNISTTDSQGVTAGNYTNMVNLLSNKDDYQFKMLITPGLIDGFASHTGTISNIVTNTQQRGDSIFVLDPVGYGSTSTAVISQAASRDTSYAASYWPWCQILDPSSGKNVWVPASTMIIGVYAYNDSVSEPWFAPAGINRGGLGSVIRVEQKLNQSTRDALYTGKVNPIGTFPGQGVVVYGQKTLQTKPSALDRVNVRRLMIELKSYISQIANTLLFEQNSIATRNTFLGQVNPYLSSVQQRQGLFAFKVVMDETNNTAAVIDRNQLVGAIYVQPTKTAEFIYLDFIITPTGATFPA